MPSGGARPGAGRPLNAKTKRTRQAAKRAERLGLLSPLDVLEHDMRFHFRRYENELAKGSEADDATVCRHLRNARDAAEAAAPFRHAKFAAVAVKTETVDPFTEFLRQLDGRSRGLPNRVDTNVGTDRSAPKSEAESPKIAGREILR